MSNTIYKGLLGITLGFTPIAQGAVLTAHSDFFVASNPNFGVPSDASDSQTQTDSTSASTLVELEYGSGLDMVRASAFVDDTGSIGTSVKGREQRFDANATASSVSSVTNNTATDVHYYYTLNIPYSQIEFNANWFSSGDTFSATHEYSVELNGSTIWNSAANLEVSSSGNTLTTNGEALPWGYFDLEFQAPSSGFEGYNASVGLELTDFSTVIDLGTWSPGQTVTVSYNLLSSVSVTAPGSCGYECFDILAYINDPSGLSGESVLGNITTVPVPGAAWLLGSGLLGLIGVSRSRNT